MFGIWRFGVAVGFAVLAASGCGPAREDAANAPPVPSVAACDKVGRQCKLPAGGLGVCDRHPSRDDGFVCTPQH